MPKRIRILFLTEVYPDGQGFLGGIFIHNQAVALQKAGCDVAVMFLDFRSVKTKRTMRKHSYVFDGITVYSMSLPCGPIYPVINMLSNRMAISLYEYAVNSFGKPDLIYAHFGDAGINAYALKRKYGIPYVIMEHDSGLLTGSADEIGKRKRQGYEHASSVLAVGCALKNKLQKYTVNEVHVVPNIVPEYMFEGKFDKNISSSDFLFISIGNLIKRKSFDLTIKGFAEVAKEKDAIKLFIVGEGPEKESLRNLARELGVEKKIKFCGRMDNRQVANLMRTCDCFVLPSKFETFGVVYVEAMACGLPVIATRCGGPEDFVHDDNGIMIDVDDCEALQYAMSAMIANRKKYHANVLRERVRRKYSAEVVAAELLEIFEGCLN